MLQGFQLTKHGVRNAGAGVGIVGKKRHVGAARSLRRFTLAMLVGQVMGVEDILIRRPSLVHFLPRSFKKRLVNTTQLFPFLKQLAASKRYKETYKV